MYYGIYNGLHITVFYGIYVYASKNCNVYIYDIYALRKSICSPYFSVIKVFTYIFYVTSFSSENWIECYVIFVLYIYTY